MEMESHSEDENFECQKRRLFETAEWTLLRLNQTINEMKSWSREREILTSDIRRLKIALSYSEKLLGDPLVMHQSQEIHRLERMNNDMRMKAESMSVALMNAERTVSWNVERKVRSEIAAFKCQVAEEKLHLAREIARLRSRLNEAEVDCTAYHEIRGKLDEYVEGDRYFDTIIAEAARKLIDTICRLSSQLIHVARESKIEDDKNKQVSEKISQPQKSVTNGINVNIEDISNEMIRLQEEKELLSTEMEIRIDKILVEKEVKVRALKRVASSLRTKLIISLGRNKKLCEQLRDFDSRKIQEKGNACVQTHSFDFIKLICSNDRQIIPNHNHHDSHHVQDVNNELIKIIEEKDKLMDQLEMERTTTREALREFEKSVRETEKKNKEIKKLQITLFSVKKKLKKTKIKNRLIKKIDKKMFFNQIRVLKIKNNKLKNELKKYKEKSTVKEEKINSLELEKNYLITEKFNLSKRVVETLEIMKIEVFSQTSEIFNDKIIGLNEKINYSKINMPKDHNKMLKNVDEEEIKLKGEIESLNKKLSDLKIESRAIEPSNTDDTRVSDVYQRMLKPPHDVKHVSKEDNVTMSTVLPNSARDLLVSQGEFTSVGNFFSTEDAPSEGINDVDTHLWIIEEHKPEKMESVEQKTSSKSRKIGFHEEEILEKNGIIDKNIFDDLRDEKNHEKWPKIEEKSMRGNWTIRNKFLRDSTPDMIMRNLEETDRELSSVKSELSSVKSEIGSLRRELESRRSKNYLLERENVALKEELGILRGKILRVQEENRGLIKLGRIGGKL